MCAKEVRKVPCWVHSSAEHLPLSTFCILLATLARWSNTYLAVWSATTSHFRRTACASLLNDVPPMVSTFCHSSSKCVRTILATHTVWQAVNRLICGPFTWTVRAKSTCYLALPLYSTFDESSWWWKSSRREKKWRLLKKVIGALSSLLAPHLMLR